MKLQFDPNQQFQLDAVSAVADLFDGQQRGTSEFSVINARFPEDLFSGLEQTEVGVGNRQVDVERIRENTRAVQDRNDIEITDPEVALESWELFDGPANSARPCPHFSVEMETGTGKTYVYLRTIFELSHRYGFQKFIIVVPSVAVREGVLHNIEITKEHFKALYNNLPFEHFVYDAKRVNRLRQFATSNTLQILVINIDAFRKNFSGTETEQRSNVIYKESDKLAGRQPIEFVQAARPIVIIDEPQSVDSTERSQEAIKALNPLLTLRYSATHKNPYNLVYRLDPVRAFELGLVKQIVVASVETDDSANEPFIRVDAIDHKPGLKAKLRMLFKTNDGPKEKSITVKQGDDLFYKSGELAHYSQGYTVADIDATPGEKYIRFSNGKTLRECQEVGGARIDVWRAQIKKTVEEHLKKEVKLRERGIKVLSLFFIDRVANYRDYDDGGHPVKGKFAEVFEEEIRSFARDERFAALDWLKLPPEKLHNGYFASDKKGVWKDSSEGRSTADDEGAYELIMRNKEQLLSMDEPLRFIFSHSALREGWDNPNVFQICTLNETRSAMKKRQEIGRGLRLPVDQSGMRVRDESVNRLYIMANESYEAFAKALQNEYEEDCGVTFGKVPITALAKLVHVVDGVELAIGRTQAEDIQNVLVQQNMMDSAGRILPGFDPRRPGFRLDLPDAHQELAPAIIDLLASYQIERHIRRERDELSNTLKKQVIESPEFIELWNRIKPKTTYRVEFETADLVRRAVAEIRHMQKIAKPVMRVRAGAVNVVRAGVVATPASVAEHRREYGTRLIPDILAYLQNETELTRSTLVEILTKSGRLSEFFNNPQKFMDQVATILKYELHRLLVDGIKYERLDGVGSHAEWEMMLFKNDEIINFLTAQQVTKSVYDYVVYDSEVEREFARRLDERDDIALFMKLPDWFHIDTPLGTYNPDWAIIKRDSRTLYLVRETKSTKNFLQLRTSEADKIRCGERHFEAIGVSYAVVTSADEV